MSGMQSKIYAYFPKNWEELSDDELFPYTQKLLSDIFPKNASGIIKSINAIGVLDAVLSPKLKNFYRMNIFRCVVFKCKFFTLCKKNFERMRRMELYPILGACMCNTSLLCRIFPKGRASKLLFQEHQEYLKELIEFWIFNGWKLYRSSKKFRGTYHIGAAMMCRVLRAISLHCTNNYVFVVIRTLFESIKKKFYRSILETFFLLMVDENVTSKDGAISIMEECVVYYVEKNETSQLRRMFFEGVRKHNIISKTIRCLEFCRDHMDRDVCYSTTAYYILHFLEKVFYFLPQPTHECVRIIRDILFPIWTKRYESITSPDLKPLYGSCMSVLCPLLQINYSPDLLKTLLKIGTLKRLVNTFFGEYGHDKEKEEGGLILLLTKDLNMCLRCILHFVNDSSSSGNFSKEFITVKDIECKFLTMCVSVALKALTDPKNPVTEELASLYRHCFPILTFPFKVKGFKKEFLKSLFVDSEFMCFVVKYYRCFPPRVLDNLNILIHIILGSETAGKGCYYDMKKDEHLYSEFRSLLLMYSQEKQGFSGVGGEDARKLFGQLKLVGVNSYLDVIERIKEIEDGNKKYELKEGKKDLYWIKRGFDLRPGLFLGTNDFRKNVGVSSIPKGGQDMCGYCSKIVVKKKGVRKRCSRCKVVFYCNRDCQRKHWKVHKKVCKVVKK